MFQAYKNYWINFTNFEGKSSRSDLWWVVLCNVLISLPLSIVGIFRFYFEILNYFLSNPTALDYMTDEESLTFALSMISSIAPIALISLIWFLVTLIPNLALEVRRYRDAGLSWAFIFLNLGMLVSIIPFFGWLIFLGCNIARLVLLVQPSKVEPEKQLDF